MNSFWRCIIFSCPILFSGHDATASDALRIDVSEKAGCQTSLLKSHRAAVTGRTARFEAEEIGNEVGGNASKDLLRCLVSLSREPQNKASAFSALSVISFRDGDRQSASSYATQAIFAGSLDRRVTYILGRCLTNLQCGQELNFNKGLEYLERSADADFAPAGFWLATMYMGRALDGDKDRAAKRMLQAAGGKFPQAMENLGVMYGRGDGLPQDEGAARQWYEAGAATGYAPAMYSLGVMTWSGDGGPRDQVKGAALLQLSSDAGYPLAKVWMPQIKSFADGHSAQISDAKRKWIAKFGRPSLIPSEPDMAY